MPKEFDLDKAIRKVPNFPKEGILYYDITSVISNPEAFRYCVDSMVELYKDMKLDAVAGIESRGFIFAAPLADRLGIPLILVRKKGKLPGKTIGKSYALEYGTAEIEIHETDIPKGGNVLLIDDLAATGGTLRAAADVLIEGGAHPIGVFSVIGLPDLHYEDKLNGIKIHTLIQFHGA